MQGSHPNPLIANFKKRNKKCTIEYHLQQVKNTKLKWRELPSAERHVYCKRLSRLQGKGFGIPRVPSWTLFYDYNIEETLKNKMKYEYLHDDRDIFVDYSWERALFIYGDVYPEWCLEFFLKMAGSKERYQKRDMWMMIVLEESRGHLNEEEVAKCSEPIEYETWTVKMAGSKEMYQKRDMWMMIVLEESRGHLNEEEVAKCSEPIEYETWTVRMLANELDEGTHTLMQTEQEASQPDQSNFAYPAYEPPNVPAYPYLYVPYLHPYTYYPDASSPSFVGDHYRAHGNGYHAGSIVPSSGYEIEGSSTGFHGEDFDLIVH
nr:hypothetical protein [Tanacetum cinerariifolium]